MCEGDFQNPYHVACCPPAGETDDSNCGKSKKCSPSYQDVQWKWYTYCPTPIKKCGSGKYFFATKEKLTFSYDEIKTNLSGIHESKREFKICYYYISIKKNQWKEANIKIRFIRIDEGINVHLMGGSDINNMTVDVVPNGGPALPGSVYKLDQS